MQHLPDGSVTVESILIQAAAHSEDPGTKVLLVSWTYQVRGGAQGSCTWQWVGTVRITPSPWAAQVRGMGRMGQQPPLASGYRMKSWGATSRHYSRRACHRPPAEAS